MNIIDELLKTILLGPGVRLSALENLKLYRAEYTINKFRAVDKDALSKVINRFPSRDEVAIHLTAQNGPPSAFSLPRELDDLAASIGPGIISLKVEIDKKQEDGHLSLYDSNALAEYLNKLTLKEQLESFDKLLKGKRFVIFKMVNVNECALETASFYFVHDPKVATYSIEPGTRNAFSAKRDSVAQISGADSLELIPKDFELRTANTTNPLKSIFETLHVAMLISTLFDHTDITKPNLAFRLSGYITLKESAADLSVSTKAREQYKSITEWAYHDGNISDKVGLARNILSLNLTSLPKLELSDHTFESIRSAYDLYLKQSVKQYLELRNKITDQLGDLGKQVTQIIDNFAAGFQKSALAVLTFFSGIIITKILAGSGLEGTFTYDAYYLTLFFVLASGGYLLLAYLEVLSQEKRFDDNYKLLKERYLNVLTNKDRKYPAERRRAQGEPKIFKREKTLLPYPLGRCSRAYPSRE